MSEFVKARYFWDQMSTGDGKTIFAETLGSELIEERQLKLNSHVNKSLLKLSGGKLTKLFAVLLSLVKMSLSRSLEVSDITLFCPSLDDDKQKGDIWLPVRSRFSLEMTLKDCLQSVAKNLKQSWAYQSVFHSDFQLVDENCEGWGWVNMPALQPLCTGRKQPSEPAFFIEFLLDEDQINLHIKGKWCSDKNLTQFLQEFDWVTRALLCETSTLVSQKFIETQFNPVSIWKYPITTPVSRIFERRVALHPEAIAVEVNGQKFSYLEINRRANKLANLLRQECAVTTGEMVGVCVDRSEHLLISMFAILKLGAVYMPLESSLPDQRLKTMSEISGLKTLIIESRHFQNRFTCFGGMSSLKSLHVCDTQHVDINLPDVLINTEADVMDHPHDDIEYTHFNTDGSQVAYVLFTSGSTGIPKGVEIENSSLVNFAYALLDAFQQEIGVGDRCLMNVNQSFDVNIFECFVPMLFGATICVLPKKHFVDAEEVCDFILEEKINLAYLPITILPDAYEYLKPRKAEMKLNKLLVGAESVRREVLGAIQTLNPEMLILNAYGPTEASVVCCALKWSSEKYLGSDNANTIAPIGTPIGNIRLLILDEKMEEVTGSEEGELYIVGLPIMKSYLNSPEQTENVIVNHPLVPGERVYKTGDLVYRDAQQQLNFVQRVDRQVKLHGFRIELSDIEYQLQQHPLISKATVQLESDEENNIIVAYVLLEKTCAEKSEPVVSYADIISFISGRLPNYMLPTYVHSVMRVPLTLSGKVDVRALTAIGQQLRENYHE